MGKEDLRTAYTNYQDLSEEEKKAISSFLLGGKDSRGNDLSSEEMALYSLFWHYLGGSFLINTRNLHKVLQEVRTALPNSI